MNHTMARVCDAGSLLLNPGRLIDSLLDRLEPLSVVMPPAQLEIILCRERRDRTRFD